MTTLVSTMTTSAAARRSCRQFLPSLSLPPSTPPSPTSPIAHYSTTPPALYSFETSSSHRSSHNPNLELSRWPITKTNTILNIVPQGQKFVVERFGKMHEVHNSGYFFAVPLMDHIAYVIDVRERALDIVPQAAITRDNVSVEVSGNLFLKVVDVELAAYGARNPMYAAMQHAQSAMRSAIGEMELDEILHNRARLNTLIKSSLQTACTAWGLSITRYEITEITPDEQIRIAMDKQAAAERDRREQVLRAEGDKRTAELTSEGVKIQLTNESEGMLIKVRNEAEAEKVRRVREAEGAAESVRVRAEAEAEAIGVVGEVLGREGGEEAARLALAHAYVRMYGEMGRESNTMFFNGGGSGGGSAADLAGLLAQVGAAVGAVPDGGKNKVGEIGSGVKSSAPE